MLHRASQASCFVVFLVYLFIVPLKRMAQDRLKKGVRLTLWIGQPYLEELSLDVL